MSRKQARILAISTGHRGFGFIVMEDGDTLVDWGLRSCSSSNAVCVRTKTKALICQYTPETILLDSPVVQGRRKAPRTVSRLNEIHDLCNRFGVTVKQISRNQVMKVFSVYGSTKQDLALGVIFRLPQLSKWYPGKRKTPQGESHRIKIFEAALLALTFYSDK